MNGKVTEISHVSNLGAISYKFIELVDNKSNVEDVLSVINSLISLFRRGELVYRKTVVSKERTRYVVYETVNPKNRKYQDTYIKLEMSSEENKIKVIVSNLDSRFDFDVDTKASKVYYSETVTSRRPNGFPKLLRETRRYFK